MHEDYARLVQEFAENGARLIRQSPASRYAVLANESPSERPLEPGYIPVRTRPLLTTISYYPNATSLTSAEWGVSSEAFERWGREGTTSAYEAAYHAFLKMRPQIPFYRTWERELYEALGLGEDEVAWLPYFKYPMPAGSRPDVDGIDAQRDREELWDQLKLIRPAVVLLQSAGVSNALRERLPNLDFIRAFETQKIPQRISNENRTADVKRIAKALRPHIDRCREELRDR